MDRVAAGISWAFHCISLAARNTVFLEKANSELYKTPTEEARLAEFCFSGTYHCTFIPQKKMLQQRPLPIWLSFLCKSLGPGGTEAFAIKCSRENNSVHLLFFARLPGVTCWSPTSLGLAELQTLPECPPCP